MIGKPRRAGLERYADATGHEADGVVPAGEQEQDDDGAYRLTELGEPLRAALQPLDGWAQDWARRLD